MSTHNTATVNVAASGSAFSATRWIELYLRREYKALVDEFMSAFSDLDERSQMAAARHGQHHADQVLKQFLYLFSQSDFIVDTVDAARLRAISDTIKSVAAQSVFRTTEPIVSLLKSDPFSHVKVSILDPTHDQPAPNAAGQVQAPVVPGVSQAGIRPHYAGNQPCQLLWSQDALYPLLCRTHGSDRYVFHQIFIEREYMCLDNVQDEKLIIDCGANVGYSSAYFLTRFPKADLIAIEPDRRNYEILESNLAPYGRSVQTLHAAVWSHASAALTISGVPYRDGREWSTQVRECDVSEPGCVRAVDIGQLLNRSAHERITILKIDIEGAEAIVFSDNCQEWLARVDNIVIELHDDSCFGNASEIFFKAIANQNFLISTCGELTVCRRQGGATMPTR